MTQTPVHSPMQRPPLAAARPPIGAGLPVRAGVLVALVALALGVAAIRDTLIAADLVGGETLTSAVVDAADGLSAADWMLPAGVVLALAGSWLIAASLWRRSFRAAALSAGTGVFVSRRAIERIAASTARDVPGVVDASAQSHRSWVLVRIGTDGERSTESEVRAAVAECLEVLDPPPSVRTVVMRRGPRGPE